MDKKRKAVLLHIICLILAVTGISMLYLNPHFGKGLFWFNSESYETSPGFSLQLQTDIDMIFDYITYKDVFEDDHGVVDLSRSMVSIDGGPSADQEYSLESLIHYAKNCGYYLNDNFDVVGEFSKENTSADDDDDGDDLDQPQRINWRAYQPDTPYQEPGDAYASLKQISYEALTCLSKYYKAYYTLIKPETNLHFTVSYAAGDDTFTNSGNMSLEKMKTLGRYVYYSSETIFLDTNIASVPDNLATLLSQNNPTVGEAHYMMLAIDTSYPYHDAYSTASHRYFLAQCFYIAGMILMLIGAAGCLGTLVWLTLDKQLDLNAADQIPAEYSIILSVLILLVGLFLGKHILFRLLHLVTRESSWTYTNRMATALIIYSVVILEYFSLLKRFKARTLWSGSLIKHYTDEISLYFTYHKFTTRLIWSYVAYLVCNLSLLGIIYEISSQEPTWTNRITVIGIILLLILVDFWVFHRLFKNALQTDMITDAVHKISDGDTSYQVDLSQFSGKELALAQSLNSISVGLDRAIQEQVKSERLKADLITNVSHDIKTPLTSIINYVDLIKREKIDHPKLQEYLAILDQKSQRLKTLTEDLVEASKASSGNVQLEINDIDFVEMIQQTNGEFEEKFSLRSLEIITNFPDESLIIESDGRRLWRVLENLYNNAFKYAMEHSRVYVDVIHEDSNVVFSIKNVSDKPLNISPDELTERFVRGDVSRTTEGSGLGLSIAKSLTTLMGGTFTIVIDGDLFKALVSFPIKNQ